ncbi:hypothetical protein BDQ12DRAFT_686786 [Crucibulum laeve]|uniref:Uncharacterized protein n=1 Tax=Crucibulum laeve TaxID=68775 RepID=A0A5C3LU93_9AGAR|nr:hypothetical protein BDQ12DRAFT_686786 [Crucibulum laeve]
MKPEASSTPSSPRRPPTPSPWPNASSNPSPKWHTRIKHLLTKPFSRRKGPMTSLIAADGAVLRVASAALPEVQEHLQTVGGTGHIHDNNNAGNTHQPPVAASSTATLALASHAKGAVTLTNALSSSQINANNPTDSEDGEDWNIKQKRLSIIPELPSTTSTQTRRTGTSGKKSFIPEDVDPDFQLFTTRESLARASRPFAHTPNAPSEASESVLQLQTSALASLSFGSPVGLEGLSDSLEIPRSPRPSSQLQHPIEKLDLSAEFEEGDFSVDLELSQLEGLGMGSKDEMEKDDTEGKSRRSAQMMSTELALL